ncbi:hypothetical protein N2152v2_005848 [Parachlorella kessleri]
MPISDKLRLFTDYVVNFDTSHRNPKWVIEHVNKKSLAGDGTRKNSEFFEDDGIEPRFRSKLTDYRGSGFDRGHMAPASNHKASQQAMDETFCLSNMSPQVGKGMNRDYWARFERFAQLLTNTCDDVWIVTGPLYLPRPSPDGWRMDYRLLGAPPQLMSVPTHYFKVVLGEVKPQFGGAAKTAVGAFVMPNAPIDPDMPLLAYTVPLSALEEVAGLRFFPAYISDDRRLALDEASLAWQRVGQAEARRLKPGSYLPPLLPGEVAAAAAAALVPKQPAGPPMVLTGAGGRGAVHVCEHTECRLPKEDWYKANGK